MSRVQEPSERETLYRELARDEGEHLQPYRDSRGFWTIGVGHLLGAMPRMVQVTLEESRALLAADVDEAVEAVYRVFPELPAAGFPFVFGARCRALVNMAFNRGEGAMRASTTITPAIRKALAAPEAEQAAAWNAVSDAVLASPWGKQIGKRAGRLAVMFATGNAVA